MFAQTQTGSETAHVGAWPGKRGTAWHIHLYLAVGMCVSLGVLASPTPAWVPQIRPSPNPHNTIHNTTNTSGVCAQAHGAFRVPQAGGGHQRGGAACGARAEGGEIVGQGEGRSGTKDLRRVAKVCWGLIRECITAVHEGKMRVARLHTHAAGAIVDLVVDLKEGGGVAELRSSGICKRGAAARATGYSADMGPPSNGLPYDATTTWLRTRCTHVASCAAASGERNRWRAAASGRLGRSCCTQSEQHGRPHKQRCHVSTALTIALCCAVCSMRMCVPAGGPGHAAEPGERPRPPAARGVGGAAAQHRHLHGAGSGGLRAH